MWEGESLSSILKDIFNSETDTNQKIIFFLTILYCYDKKPLKNLNDFIRVVRNLIANTDDNSRREWPRLITSLQNLISDENVYVILPQMEDDKLIGFRLDQRKEEVFKSKLYLTFPDFQKDIFRIEDNKNFKGNITNILKSPDAKTETEYDSLGLNSIEYNESKLKSLISIFKGYEELSIKDFNPIWGNLLITGLYEQTWNSRLIYNDVYKKHPAVLMMSKNYVESKLDLNDYIIKIQKAFITKKRNEYDNFSSIRNVKEQLYIYYIINERIYGEKPESFFKNSNFNVGWLPKGKEYKSFYTEGIEGCQYFPESNPIFQLYNQQFRYNEGIKGFNTLDIEIIGGNKKRNPFELIIKWASS